MAAAGATVCPHHLPGLSEVSTPAAMPGNWQKTPEPTALGGPSSQPPGDCSATQVGEPRLSRASLLLTELTRRAAPCTAWPGQANVGVCLLPLSRHLAAQGKRQAAHLARKPAFGRAEADARLRPSVKVAAIVLHRPEFPAHGANNPQVLLLSLRIHHGGVGAHLEEARDIAEGRSPTP
ncbi:hypothetical protein MC885_012294 [Smutsia gigantea]|nr:hypothetical protein MC885_012294 [Smutsia gigantea]